MINGKRVIAWTPYGREETVSVLGRYLRREHERGVIDEWWLCLNTDPNQVNDLAFAYTLANHYPWIVLRERPAGRPRRTPKQRNTGYFYEYMIDPDTIFVRFDDDIVYVHENCIGVLVTHQLENPTVAASFPVMWNNAVVSWFAQQAGVIPAPGTRMPIPRPVDLVDMAQAGTPDPDDVAAYDTYTWPKVGGPYCMDPVGWADGRFAVALHRLLLQRVTDGEPEKCFLYQDYQLQLGLQFSVSTFASSGAMYAGLEQPGVLVPYEEEHWHTQHRPKVTGVPNVLVGDALVSHFTFYPQGAIVRATDVLDRYRRLARKLTS